MVNKKPVVLIYKRTHIGDPDSDGVFGINDCMGRIRDRNYDAVIGIGGKKPWRGHEDIALKINWIGIEPTKHNSARRGSFVTFSKFCLLDDRGPLIRKLAPKLYKYLYVSAHRRTVMSSSLPSSVFKEISEILKLAEECLPSKGLPEVDAKERKCR